MEFALIWTALGIIALLALSGFFSGSETALTAASRFKLHSMAEKGDRAAMEALDLTEDNERLIGSVLLGNNLVNILATSLTTSVLTSVFGGGTGIIVATAIMTALILIFAEVLPKTYAITQPETASRWVARPITIVVRVLAPIVTAVRALVRGILALFGVSTDPDSNVLAARDEIAGAIALHHSEGAVPKDDRDRLLGALDLKSREVDEIMLHRSNIEMIDVASEPQDILTQCLHSPHTRIPVFEGQTENIIGVLHAKDLLRSLTDKLIGDDPSTAHVAENFDIRQVMMNPYFVPDTTTLDDQMRQFLRRRAHFALVVNEYGDLQGLITLEDILEEIVGDIADEHDALADGIEPDADGSFIIDGSMTIRDLNRAHDWALPDDEANTLAGLVIHEAQTIPEAGQVFSYHGFRFEVVTRERNRLTSIRVKPLQ